MQAAAGQIALSISMDQAPPADAVIFDWNNSLATAVPTTAETKSVSTLLPGSGTFGVTHAPGAVGFTGDIGAPPLSSATLPDSLRNLETSTFTSAFFDGQ
ncbi:MAG TPA: hypothetical protein VH142_17820, partial [Polyangiaceae bacterium]|nr:hypothetical protein [Polyangiaceae bacterium]